MLAVLQTSRADFRAPEITVTRRYRDFSWLASRLETEYPGAIIPPLPEKNVVRACHSVAWRGTGDPDRAWGHAGGALSGRFSAAFVEERRRALERFLNQVATHPLLRSSGSW